MPVPAQAWPEFHFPPAGTGDGWSRTCGVLPGTPQLLRDEAAQTSGTLTPLYFFPYLQHFETAFIFHNC